jgi:hypothetical protein
MIKWNSSNKIITNIFILWICKTNWYQLLTHTAWVWSNFIMSKRGNISTI